MTAFQRLDYKKLISEPSVSCVSVRIMEVSAFWCVRLEEIKENPLYTLEEDQNLSPYHVFVQTTTLPHKIILAKIGLSNVVFEGLQADNTLHYRLYE